MMSIDRNYKIIILGETNVGKTSYIKLYKHGFFNEIQPTIGVDYDVVIVKKENENIKLKIWDTAGQERFRSIINRFYKNISGAIIFFDCTNIHSIQSIDYWENEIKQHVGEIPVVIVANKWSLLDENVYEKYLKDIKPFIKIDNKKKLNINEPIETLTQLMYEGDDGSFQETSANLSNVPYRNLFEKNVKGCCTIS
tara:strand:+ start:226 stop:813 length:588 start_codon:yes stop_codon:yes gene_type:complete